VVDTALLVILGGGGGALARFAVDGLVGSRWSGEFPLGTFVVNVTGAWLLGFLAGLGVSHHAMLLAGTATIGSYTTYSTWMLETHRLAEDGERGLAWRNVGFSVAAGLAAVAAGKAIGGLL
jgi:CrcB protein